MPLEDLDSPEAVEAFKSQNAGGALICFSATWCGPCKEENRKEVRRREQEMIDSKKEEK